MPALMDAQHRRSAARKAGDRRTWIEAARDCGQAHFELGEYGLAVKLFAEAVELIAASGERRELLADLHGMAGRAHQRLRAWDGAADAYRFAAQAASDARDPGREARWRGKLGALLAQLGRHEEGVAQLRAAVDLARGCVARGEDAKRTLSDVLGNLAVETKGDEADALWKENLALLETMPRGPAHYYTAAGYAEHLALAGQPDLAATFQEEALEIGHALNLEPARLRAGVHALVTVLGERHPDRAGDLLLAQVADEHDLRERHRLISEAVQHYYRGRQWARMRRACLMLKEMRDTRHGTPLGRFEAEMFYAVACHEMRDFDEALRSLERASHHAEGLDAEAKDKAAGQTAVVLAAARRYAEAVAIARRMWDAGTHHRLTARTLVESLAALGDTATAAKVRDEFEGYGAQALDLAWMKGKLADAGLGQPLEAWYDYGLAARRAPEQEAEALTALYAHHAAGSADRFEVARARLRLIDKARPRVDDVFSDASWLAVTAWAPSFPSFLDDALHAAVAAGRNADALYELERYRSQMLVNVMTTRAVRWRNAQGSASWLKATTTDRMQRARYRLAGLKAVGAPWKERREAALEAQEYESRSLTAGGIIELGPKQTGLLFPQDLEEHVRDTDLRGDERLVFLHAGASRGHCWVLDAARRVEHLALPRLTAGAVGSLRAEQDAAALRVLDDIVVAPLLAHLSADAPKRLFVVAGTAVTALPLNCSASALASGIEFCFLPSARALGFARAVRFPAAVGPVPYACEEDLVEASIERMNQTRGRMAVVVDPSRTLQLAPVEAAIVQRTYDGMDMEVVPPERADAETVAAAARRAGILHMVAHGTFEDAGPYRSGMYVRRHADNASALWTIAEVLTDTEAPGGRLAVLSGCETARVRDNPVSEEISLPAAFLAAGYAAVIGSRWKVADLPSALLMGEVHRRWSADECTAARALAESADWLRGITRTEAAALVTKLPELAEGLSDQQLAELRKHCHETSEWLSAGAEHPFADPSFWAAFFVSGDGAITFDGDDPRVPSREKARRPAGNG